ncbi:hypothetical protein C2G38_2202537 [Gigaspora rosea]|uniref:Uncharacterized protein n=1 Tax=Gigaspora rosea TaxID=44941 RepID=A0A397USM0_9GLOM|nr:hypothetical protein C2G38_2202537 [Gigaspora rosea]
MPDKVYEWNRFFQEDLEKGINKTLDHFEKWFAPWHHLSLPWAKLPDDLELRFAEELEDDLRNGKTDSLGFYELLLKDNDFSTNLKNSV